MFLKWLLAVANLVGGFIAASAYITSKMPTVADFSKTLTKSKLPIGLTVLGISIINIFNFGTEYYPKLSLIFGLLTGIVLSVEILSTLGVDEDIKIKAIDISDKFSVPCGLISIILGIIFILVRFLNVIEPLL
ncbi:MAG: hypothetical protein PHF84_08645 [bacterium]|nr:hypothetical protein [bacterium]